MTRDPTARTDDSIAFSKTTQLLDSSERFFLINDKYLIF